jgi:hypothetical protein
VLALEFRGVSDTADFGFLARAGAASLYRVDPLVSHISRQLPLREQARDIAEELPESPRLIIAYCATAALGAHIAEMADAPLLLIDPYPVTAQDILRDLDELCRTLGCETASSPASAASPDMTAWELALHDSRDRLAARFGSDGIAYDMADDLLDRYRAWLRFLSASMEAGLASPRGGVAVITGKFPSLMDALLTEPAKVRIFQALPSGGTLDSPEVRALLLSAVAITSGRDAFRSFIDRNDKFVDMARTVGFNLL